MGDLRLLVADVPGRQERGAHLRHVLFGDQMEPARPHKRDEVALDESRELICSNAEPNGENTRSVESVFHPRLPNAKVERLTFEV
jgi:hypothetical protein